MPATQLIQTVAELCEALNQARDQVRAQRQPQIALVPTMGNLHDGHISLVRAAKMQSDLVVTSIFVNPLQFTPGGDYDQYPRTLDADFARLAKNNVDIVFTPSVDEMYPQGQSNTRVTVQGFEQDLCGALRPGHFEGVTTVVNMLLNLVQPQLAFFGQKDYQQMALIKRMVSDLHLPVEIVGVPIVRAEDGLALSSRNQYLSTQQRETAPKLYAIVQAAAASLQAGNRDYVQIESQGMTQLREQGFEADYFAVRTPDLYVPHSDTAEFMVFASAHLGNARLIDNLRVVAGAG